MKLSQLWLLLQFLLCFIANLAVHLLLLYLDIGFGRLLETLGMVNFVLDDYVPGLQQLSRGDPFTPVYLQHLFEQSNKLVAEVVPMNEAVEAVPVLRLAPLCLCDLALVGFDILLGEEGGQLIDILHLGAGGDERPAQNQLAQDGPDVEHDRPLVYLLGSEHLLGGQVFQVL